MGGSGVQRSLKFVKFLRNFGYEPVVVTKKRLTATDSSFSKDIDPNTEIIYVDGPDYDTKSGFLGKIQRYVGNRFLIPDTEITWAQKALPVCQERLKKGDIDLIYTTSFPYSDHLLGLWIKKTEPRYPWLADFRDEWTLNPYILDMKRSKTRMSVEMQMEQEVLRSCDFMVTNTDKMLEGFLTLSPGLKTKSAVIPNGFDSDDFEGISAEPDTDLFRITYAGSLYGRRNPYSFFEALSQLLEEKKLDRDKIKVDFIGNMKDGEIAAKAESLGLGGIVSIKPYMEHAELLKRLGKSAALLLIIGSGVGSENFSSGKVFEYINMRRNILALVPPKGEAAKIIKETNSGLIADTQDIAGIKRNLLSLYEGFMKGKYYPFPNEEKIAKYHRRRQTERLAELFDGLLEKAKAEVEHEA